MALTQGGGNYRLSVTDSHPWFWVHERGALIQGNPLLWLPLSGSGVPRNTYARNYPGRLFRVDRKSGPPILMDASDKSAKYVGLPEVTVKKKFHIEEIIADVASKMTSYYRQHFQENAET